MRPARAIAAFAVAVGACDAATGTALIVAPLATLRLLGIAASPAEPVFLRWIGAFVLGVGLSYLYPYLLRGGGASRRDRRLATVFEVTALMRGLVALVAGAAIASGALEPAWLGVPMFDAAVAATQLLVLRRAGLGHG